MPLTLVSDSTTRSVSEGLLAENKQPQPLADASGYKVSAIRNCPASSKTEFVVPRAGWISQQTNIRSAMHIRQIRQMRHHRCIRREGVYFPRERPLVPGKPFVVKNLQPMITQQRGL